MYVYLGCVCVVGVCRCSWGVCSWDVYALLGCACVVGVCVENQERFTTLVCPHPSLGGWGVVIILPDITNKSNTHMLTIPVNCICRTCQWVR